MLDHMQADYSVATTTRAALRTLSLYMYPGSKTSITSPAGKCSEAGKAVSYTHLTLPTKA